MQELVKYSKLRLRPAEERLRSKIGDLTDLKKSLKRNGQIHDLLVDKDWFVRIGTRRFMAMEGITEHVKIDRREDLSEEEWLILEAEENIIRKNFNTVEEAIALSKSKRAWEILHPETKQGGDRDVPKDEKTGKFVTSSGQTVRLKVEKKFDPTITVTAPDPMKKPLDTPIEAFTKHMAVKTGVSERTIRRKVEFGEAILEGKIDKQTVEMVKKKEISQHKAMKKLKEDEDRKYAEILKRRQEEAKIRPKPKVDFPKPEPVIKADLYRKVWMCEECAKADVRHCPECKNGFIICRKSGNLPFMDLNAEACKDIEKP